MKRLHEIPNTILADQPDTIYVWMQRDGAIMVIGRHDKNTYAESLERGLPASMLPHCVSSVANSINRERGTEKRMPCILRFENEVI